MLGVDHKLDDQALTCWFHWILHLDSSVYILYNIQPWFFQLQAKYCNGWGRQPPSQKSHISLKCLILELLRIKDWQHITREQQYNLYAKRFHIQAKKKYTFFSKRRLRYMYDKAKEKSTTPWLQNIGCVCEKKTLITGSIMPGRHF